MAQYFKINDRTIGDNLNPYIIAEIGVNHEGCLTKAKELIDKAAEAGAHAAKFQSYKAELIASKNSPAYWDTSKEPTQSQYKLFKKYDAFGPDEYNELAKHCITKKIDFMSTPFDLEAVDFLNDLVPAFKIASADITNIPLIRKCAATGKPLIISTGASTLPEIELALNTAKNAGAKDIALLHCVLNYPTPEENAQLGMISTLKRIFPEHLIGYSDHVAPDETISALECAVNLGACILEKHFTDDKSLPGNDHYHSMDRDDLIRFIHKLKKYATLIKGVSKDITSELAARKHARRSIVASTEILEGDIFTEANLVAKRPGHGISTVHWDEIIGKKASKSIEEDDLLTWNSVSFT